MRLLFWGLYVVFLAYCSDVNPTNRQISNRVKRVVYGIPLNDTNFEYISLFYFVWISNGHDCDISLSKGIKDVLGLHEGYELNVPNPGWFTCDPEPNHLKCTGSQLTPTIVQTACHCVTHIVTGTITESTWPVALDSWENMFIVFSGINYVSQMTQKARSRKYFYHPKCLRFGGSPFPIVYDYGLIQLADRLDSYVDHNRLAPHYRIPLLAKYWKTFMATQPVCLVIGFGYFLGGGVPTKSHVVRHSWQTMLDYLTCYKKTYPNPLFSDLIFNYTDQATWVCLQPLPKLESYSGPGDSGGPVSCNNVYAGLVSQGSMDDGVHVATVMSTAFTPLENSVEYRRSLIQALASDQGYQVAYNQQEDFTPPIYRVFEHRASSHAKTFPNLNWLPFSLCLGMIFISRTYLNLLHETENNLVLNYFFVNIIDK